MLSAKDRATLSRVASDIPEAKKVALLGKEAAYPRTAIVNIQMITRGFLIQYQQQFAPVGLAAENVAALAMRAREGLNTFVARLGDATKPMAVKSTGTYVLLTVMDGNIVFNVEGVVQVVGNNKVTQANIVAAEATVFDRFGYQVNFI